MSGILCLKWNNHTSTFLKSLDVLRTKELYCDATIACQGKFFPVHRFVLSTCSEYFEEIFERTQCKHPFIILKDVEEFQLEALLNYMYKGEVNVLQDRLPGLIRAAEALQVKGLAVSEDISEEKKTVKEKRKSNSSSPLQPKSKRKLEEKVSQQKSIHKQQRRAADDDEISEIPNENSLSQSGKQLDEEQKPKEDADNSDARNMENNGLNFQSITESQDALTNNTEQVEDIKVEPSEIFEAVEENIAETIEAQSRNNGKEDSLFVSLLSPNNAHSMSEDELSGNNGDNHPVPQCSSWNDDVSTNSDKTHDEMEVLMKPMVTFEEGAISGLCLGEVDGGGGLGEEVMRDSPLNLRPFADNPTSVAAEMYYNLTTPHQCPHCTHRTKTKAELLRHVSYYHSDFRFTCSLCHYKCRTNGLLKKHMLKHTKEKPYTCPICPYKTARKQHLVRHSKLHTGEKPFECPICAYKASRKDRLREHLRKHRELNNIAYD